VEIVPDEFMDPKYPVFRSTRNVPPPELGREMDPFGPAPDMKSRAACR
jgi:hypothetical protein